MATRGVIALIQSGTGTVVGTCEIDDVVGPRSLAKLRRTTAKHRVPPSSIGRDWSYETTYAWVLRRPRRLSKPVPYRRRRGQVISARLTPKEAAAIARAGGSLPRPS